MIRLISGLLLELAHRALLKRLVLPIALSRRNLQGIAVEGMTELTHHQDTSVRKHRQYRSRALMMDEIPVGLMPADIHIVIVDGDDLPLIGKLPLDQLYRFLCIIFV